MDIRIALAIDVLLIFGSLYGVLQVSDKSIFNPSMWYLLLHAYTVTFRLITLNLGGQSLTVIGIRSDTELVNAAIASDVSLLAAVAATVLIAHRRPRESFAGREGSFGVQLIPYVGQVISIVCLTIGTYALVKYGTAAAALAKSRGVEIAAISIGRFDESSYPIWISGFAVQGALIQCAARGFTRWRVVLLTTLLVMSAFNARTVGVLGAAMAFLVYQTRRRQTSIPAKGALCIVLLGLVWFVFKPVGAAIVGGESAEEIWLTAQNYFEDSIDNNSSIDTQFLDMQATYMAAADDAGRRFHGATLLPLLYLPIPRFLWPDKPPLNMYGPELSTSSRMMAQVGMTPLLSGESYLNFGWIGCALIPFLYVLCMQIGYQRVRSDGIHSGARWVYMIYLISMIQVFRDGLEALVLYPFLQYLPLLSWALISGLLAPPSAAPIGRVKQWYVTPKLVQR